MSETDFSAEFGDFVVQDVPGYNSWPMIGTLGNTLVCAYSRGSAHTVGESKRGVYARTSVDGGKTWSQEKLISNLPDCGEVTIGKGLDKNGALLIWIRRWHTETNRICHALYRSTDGENFTLLGIPELNPIPMQITDIFQVPGVGLMSLWFAGYYKNDGTNFWGTLTSSDNGKTWQQHIIESGLQLSGWPTEPSAVYLGNGRILAIARNECANDPSLNFQFQLQSGDYGKTWSCKLTNIGDVRLSTPSLIFDSETGILSNYYYQRGKGLLMRRVNRVEDVWNQPQNWSSPEVVARGSAEFLDAGNVNAVKIADTHFLSYYSGKDPDTAVIVSVVSTPQKH